MNIRVAYQIPENKKYPAGRSFEEAFIKANLSTIIAEKNNFESNIKSKIKEINTQEELAKVS